MKFEDCKVGQHVIANHTNIGVIKEIDVYNGEILVEFKDMSAWIYPKYLEVKEMENYICINGKKTELTQEQLRQLGIEIPKTKEELHKEWKIQTNFHAVLYAKLRDFAFENGSADIDWSNTDQWKYYLVYDHDKERWVVGDNRWRQTLSTIYFITKEIANRAIKEIVEPFMKENPYFKW